MVVAVFKDEKADEGFLKELDSATGGLVRSILESEELKGKEGETAYVHLSPSANGMKAKRLLLVGAGERADYKLAQVSQLAGAAVRHLRARSVKSVGVVPRFEGEEDAGRVASAAAEGALIGLFEPDKYRTVEKEERTVDSLVVIVEGADDEALRRGAERGRVVGESVNFTRDLANEPGAYMTPTIMAERAQQIANEFGLEIDVLDQARMRRRMGALLSVARGSDQPPKLMVLKYMPEGKTSIADGEGYLALVGKGITFDTGASRSSRREHGADEVRHEAGRPCSASCAPSRSSSLRPPSSASSRHREHAFRQGDEARRRGARHVRQDDRGHQHGRRGPTDSGRRRELREETRGDADY